MHLNSSLPLPCGLQLGQHCSCLHCKHCLAGSHLTLLAHRSPREASEGFELLDLNDGALWDLTLRMMAYQPGDRISAREALQHPAFGRSALSRAVRNATNKAGEVIKVRHPLHCCALL